MRQCSACGKADAPWFTSDECTCGAYSPQDDDPSLMKHAPNCHGIAHEVLMYPVRMAVNELTAEKKLGRYYASRGWSLKQDGLRWYRVKMLCRQCIIAEDQAQERKRDYEDACKKARGVDNQSYAQMLAQQ